MEKKQSTPVRTKRVVESPEPRSNGREPEPEPRRESRGPTDKIRLFPVEAAIWMRYSAEGRPMFSVTFQRSYKDQKGEWQRTTSFSGGDLLVLAEAARAAFTRIEDIKAEERANAQPRPQQRGYRASDSDVPF